MRLLKRIALTISIITTSTQLIAQGFDTVFFNSDWVVTSIDKAVYYRKSGFNPQIPSYDSTVTDYYMDTDQVEMIGQYKNGLKSGTFHFYDPNRKLKSVANYKENERIGNWKEFYQNGVLKINIEYEDNIERILELNDSLGNSLIKRNRFKYILTYSEASEPFFGVVSSFEDATYNISGTLHNNLRHGKWIVRKGKRHYVTLKYSLGRMKNGFYYIHGQRAYVHHEYFFPLIFDHKKFHFTESFVFEPGAKIRNNYVTQGLHEYRYKSMKKVTVKSYEDLEKYLSNHFDFRAKQPTLIEIILEINNGLITTFTTIPRIPASAMKDLQLIFETIEILEFVSNTTITIEYLAEPVDIF